MANAAQSPSPAMQQPSPADGAPSPADASPSPAEGQSEGTVFCLEDRGDGTFGVWQDDDDSASGDDDGDAQDNAQTFDSLEKAVAALYKLAQENPAGAGGSPEDQFSQGFSGSSAAQPSPITSQA